MFIFREKRFFAVLSCSDPSDLQSFLVIGEILGPSCFFLNYILIIAHFNSAVLNADNFTGNMLLIIHAAYSHKLYTLDLNKSIKIGCSKMKMYVKLKLF